jgi:hypothetical protein
VGNQTKGETKSRRGNEVKDKDKDREEMKCKTKTKAKDTGGDMMWTPFPAAG